MAELHFTQAPDVDEPFQVGSQVEVYCDHEDKNGNRIRDWIVGTVVQVDPKMVAVQFQQNVYLTNGWMVPDKVLWCPKDSANIRLPRKRRRILRSRGK